ncbi:MAG: DUF4159 domain-containing protein [Planctomycetota bacterium]
MGCGLLTFGRNVWADIDASSVQQSIDRGVQYLRQNQNARGGWPEYGNQSCGLSALCTLSMLNGGVANNDPAMRRALSYLRGFEPRETYSVSLQTLVYCQVGAAADLPRIRRNVRWLSEQQNAPEAYNPGAWGYTDGRQNGDPSNSQFALLALGAAVDRGIRVDPSVFTSSVAYWKRQQLSRGGWGYGSRSRASGSMTCAGIASLIIARTAVPNTFGDRVECCRDEEDDASLAKGLEYLSQIFTVRTNPGGELLSYFYYMYAIERVGRLSGRRLIGQHDWYREGAETLVRRQDGFQGFWQGEGVVESNRLIATAFAVLFLAKGKRQVVVGQFEHPSVSPVEPTSLRSLVRHVEKEWRRDLTWQTITGSQADVDDLLQTPVLIIAGRGSISLDEKIVSRLGQYLDQGGTILFDAQAGDGCGDATEFERDVRRLCETWYPGVPLERLPPDHPVWSAQKPADPAKITNNPNDDYWVYGVGACCRTPVFYSPRSLTCRWRYGDAILIGADLPNSILEPASSAITIGENIIAYATGRELKNKLDASQIVGGVASPPAGRSAITIATGSLNAGERQVRRAMPNAAALIRDRLALEVIAVDEPIELTTESLSRVGALYLQGQSAFELTPQSRDALRTYLQRFGIVIASPICGDESFAKSFRSEISAILGDDLQVMPADHVAFTTRFGGYDLRNITIRMPRMTAMTQDNRGANDGAFLDDSTDGQRDPEMINRSQGSLRIIKRSGSPMIEVGMTDGVPNVFFSPLDLSCALESQNSIQCPGYDTADAAQILAGLLLYALQQ